jgi:MFS family permease
MNKAKITISSSLGSMFEIYDFFIFITLTDVIGKVFFSGFSEKTGCIFSLLVFAIGFVARPFGGLLFGYIGDKFGRKITFLSTIFIAGISTALIGCLPSYSDVGILSPILLVILRMIQGISFGGELCGSIVYVAEHSVKEKRGFNTSWIFSIGTLGILMANAVVAAAKTLSGVNFYTWGWRIPFIISILFLLIIVYLRLSMKESPVFSKLVADKNVSKSPIIELITNKNHCKKMVVAFFGFMPCSPIAVMMAFIFPIIFLVKYTGINESTVLMLVCFSMIVSTPFYGIAGWLSDKIGRKPMIYSAGLICALLYIPSYHALYSVTSAALINNNNGVVVQIVGARNDCSLNHTQNLSVQKMINTCAVARKTLDDLHVSYTLINNSEAHETAVRFNYRPVISVSYEKLKSTTEVEKNVQKFALSIQSEVAALKKENTGFIDNITKIKIFGLLCLLGIFTALASGAVPAMIGEFFPSRIRYSASSLAYNLVNIVFSGFVPVIILSINSATNTLYAGLGYPIAVFIITIIIGLLFVPETKGLDIG